MKTGLCKKNKNTSVYFNEADALAEITTHNTSLRKRLQAFAEAYPDLCQMTGDDGQGGLDFTIRKDCISLHLNPPRSDTRREQARQRAKDLGLGIRVKGRNSADGE